MKNIIVGDKTAEQLIELLQKMPKDAIVYKDGGDFVDDWRRVYAVNNLDAWGTKGVLIS